MPKYGIFKVSFAFFEFFFNFLLNIFKNAFRMKFAKRSDGHFATKIGMLVCTIGELEKKMAFLMCFFVFFEFFEFFWKIFLKMLFE